MGCFLSRKQFVLTVKSFFADQYVTLAKVCSKCFVDKPTLPTDIGRMTAPATFATKMVLPLTSVSMFVCSLIPILWKPKKKVAIGYQHKLDHWKVEESTSRVPCSSELSFVTKISGLKNKIKEELAAGLGKRGVLFKKRKSVGDEDALNKQL